MFLFIAYLHFIKLIWGYILFPVELIIIIIIWSRLNIPSTVSPRFDFQLLKHDKHTTLSDDVTKQLPSSLDHCYKVMFWLYHWMIFFILSMKCKLGHMDGLTSFLPVSLLISTIYKPLTLMVNEFMNTPFHTNEVRVQTQATWRWRRGKRSVPEFNPQLYISSPENRLQSTTRTRPLETQHRSFLLLLT